MATIVFASSKGGCGKTTCCVLVACELAIQAKKQGFSVALIDADPNQHSALWSKKDGCPNNIELISSSEDSLLDDIETAEKQHAFVIIDLEGTASLSVGHAVCRSDLVIIPCQGSNSDAREALKTVKLIKNQSKALRINIPFAILITRSPPMIIPRTLKNEVAQFHALGIDVFSCQLIERDAFKAVFSFGGSLYDLDKEEVSNIPKAINNISSLTEEIKQKLHNYMNEGRKNV